MRKQYKELTPAEKMIVGLIYDVYSQFYYQKHGSTHLKNTRVHDLRDFLKTDAIPELDKSYDEPKNYSDLGKFVTSFQNQTN